MSMRCACRETASCTHTRARYRCGDPSAWQAPSPVKLEWGIALPSDKSSNLCIKRPKERMIAHFDEGAAAALQAVPAGQGGDNLGRGGGRLRRAHREGARQRLLPPAHAHRYGAHRPCEVPEPFVSNL